MSPTLDFPTEYSPQTRSGRIYNPFMRPASPVQATGPSSHLNRELHSHIYPPPSPSPPKDQSPRCNESIWQPGKHSEDIRPCEDMNIHQVPHYVCAGCRDNVKQKLDRFERKTQRMTQLELCSRCTHRSLRDLARLGSSIPGCQCRDRISKRWRCFECRLDANEELTDAHNVVVRTLISPHGCMMCPCGLAMPGAVQLVTICSQCRQLTVSEGQDIIEVDPLLYC